MHLTVYLTQLLAITSSLTQITLLLAFNFLSLAHILSLSLTTNHVVAITHLIIPLALSLPFVPSTLNHLL
uniref:Uncharacterized protein n=1 Tax=Octopus bimaculoides TaxID=37653 RepID=A0A0L8IA43_OCTBM